MVYNAMKMFMEINPQLFDDCSHDYTELQNTADQRQANRQSKWDRLAEQAKQMRAQNGVIKTKESVPPSGTPRGSKGALSRLSAEEIDPVTHDSQKRLDALKLQDENSRDPGRDYEAQSPVSLPCPVSCKSPHIIVPSDSNEVYVCYQDRLTFVCKQTLISV